jgi:hypothetical protein
MIERPRLTLLRPDVEDSYTRPVLPDMDSYLSGSAWHCRQGPPMDEDVWLRTGRLLTVDGKHPLED